MSITAFLPGALDKLLGIFLLTIICQQLFVIGTAMTILLLAVGAFTIISAVFMAMAQHDMRKLLAYHAVSQVGYMVIGIASGTAIGIAGAVFHMLNNTIYKSALFLTGGAVEHRTGTTDLGRLGGLSKYMPVTFVICVIASLSISGIPPLNGFVSKWMVYQGLFQQVTNPDFANPARACFAIALAVAMFGSALTLASFIKVLHSVFLGQPSGAKNLEEGKPREVGFTMLLPMGILALLCVIFGITAYTVPLKTLILPALFPFGIYLEPMSNLWQPGPALALIILGIILGLIVYFVSNAKVRRDIPFTGGENPTPEGRFEGLEFYKSVNEIGLFSYIYRLAEKKYFDIYDIFTKLVLGIGAVLSELHTGSVRTYMLWFILGFIAIFAFLMGKF
jgi:formate hydrogenlyase subunit 3/multisubunit Na+/H+ antiporter MnhD subunit